MVTARLLLFTSRTVLSVPARFAPRPAAIAGSTNMSSLVVMSKGTKFTQQSYKVSGERSVLQGPVAAGKGLCMG